MATEREVELTLAVSEMEDVASFERAWFEGRRPTYQPSLPAPPMNVDECWVYEEEVEGHRNGNYTTEWQDNLLECRLEVEKLRRKLAFDEYDDEERRKKGKKAVHRVRRQRKGLQQAEGELARAQEPPPYGRLSDLIQKHIEKGMEEDFRLRNVRNGAIIGPADLVAFTEGLVGLDAGSVEAYVRDTLMDGSVPLMAGYGCTGESL
jgi:hypothetical protein